MPIFSCGSYRNAVGWAFLPTDLVVVRENLLFRQPENRCNKSRRVSKNAHFTAENTKPVLKYD
ncbi:MAG: hypothetical protein IJ881_05280 [Neisseriaceae bacterium]|nr:hypothetical protein [Neisseriaceae bacterium]